MLLLSCFFVIKIEERDIIQLFVVRITAVFSKIQAKELVSSRIPLIFTEVKLGRLLERPLNIIQSDQNFLWNSFMISGIEANTWSNEIQTFIFLDHPNVYIYILAY